MTKEKKRIRAKARENTVRGEPSFFCETCGHQVGAYEDECSHCGMPFYGVRCPSCGFNGKARQFVNGCPRCGYKAAPADSYEILNPEGLEGPSKKTKNQSAWLPLLMVFILGTAAAAIIVVLLL